MIKYNYYYWRPRASSYDSKGEFSRICNLSIDYICISRRVYAWRSNSLPIKTYLKCPVHLVPDVLILLVRGEL